MPIRAVPLPASSPWVYNKEFQVARDLAGSTKGALADIITDGLNRYSTNPEKLNSYLEVHSGNRLGLGSANAFIIERHRHHGSPARPPRTISGMIRRSAYSP